MPKVRRQCLNLQEIKVKMYHYIYGAGGHGKVVLDAMQVSGIQCMGFVDDKDISVWSNLNVYNLRSLNLSQETIFHLAIGNCKTRELIVSKLKTVKFFTVRHTAAVISNSASIGIGTFLAAQCVIAPDATVGNHCIINHASVVDHDCFVGDYTHIAPQAALGGGVTIGRGVFIGAGAVILPGLNIEDYAVVGAGAIVTKNVAAGTTVVGNPAKIFIKS